MDRAFKVVSSMVFVSVVAAAAAVSSLASTYRSAARRVCDLIHEHYYKREMPEVRQFISDCRAQAQEQSLLFSKSENVQRINDRLATFRISHLELYEPAKNKMMWENHGLDTGIRSRMVDDHLVVYRLLPGSPAERAGLKLGDSLVGLNDQLVPSPYHAQTGSGRFRILRGDVDERVIEIRPVQLTEDMRTTLTDLGGGKGLLRIPSFLPQYFENGEWEAIAKRLTGFKSLIIDLRDNSGGSFPAMLRVLSPFRCKRPVVGLIYRAETAPVETVVDLKDNLEAKSQLDQLKEASILRLRSFPKYGCYDGPATVLIDAGTNSVSEIFAQAFLTREGSRVWGQPTAGQVVMAYWIPVPELGDDHHVSIPIAGYVTSEGIELEGRVVQPEKFLFYDLKVSREGRDSWLEEAMRGSGATTRKAANERPNERPNERRRASSAPSHRAEGETSIGTANVSK